MRSGGGCGSYRLCSQQAAACAEDTEGWGRKPERRKGDKGGGPQGRHPPEGVALLPLSLELSLVSAQDFYLQRILGRNHDISKVGLRSGPSRGLGCRARALPPPGRVEGSPEGRGVLERQRGPWGAEGSLVGSHTPRVWPRREAPRSPGCPTGSHTHHSLCLQVWGTWYSISMAADDMRWIEEDGDLRVFMQSIESLENGGLQFSLPLV